MSQKLIDQLARRYPNHRRSSCASRRPECACSLSTEHPAPYTLHLFRKFQAADVFLRKISHFLRFLVHWTMVPGQGFAHSDLGSGLCQDPNPQGRISLLLHSKNAFICFNLRSLVPGDFPACLLSARFLPQVLSPLLTQILEICNIQSLVSTWFL